MEPDYITLAEALNRIKCGEAKYARYYNERSAPPQKTGWCYWPSDTVGYCNRTFEGRNLERISIYGTTPYRWVLTNDNS